MSMWRPRRRATRAQSVAAGCAGGAAGRIRCDRPLSATGSQPVSVAIVDYGSGNLHSAAKAFERAARESGHDQPIVVTRDPDAVARADRVVLPGVGAFADCRRGLDAVPGMVEALDDGGAPARPAVPRHLRRHAAHGRARPRIRGDAGPRLDRRRRRSHRALRSRPQDPAYGLEHAQRGAAPSAARRHRDRRVRAARLFRALLRAQGRGPRTIWWRRPTTAAPSPPSSAATPWWARSSIPRRASAWVSR